MTRPPLPGRGEVAKGETGVVDGEEVVERKGIQVLEDHIVDAVGSW